MEFINIADLTNPETGKTYRQENRENVHNIPLGTLVETFDGLRLWVVRHDRDCDETPLYSLSFKKDWKEMENYPFHNQPNSPIFPGKLISRAELSSGYGEDSLTVINREETR